MTQVEKTEAVLDAAMCKSYRVGGAIAEIEAVTAHARDLARKLDAIRAACLEREASTWKSEGQLLLAINDILDADQ